MARLSPLGLALLLSIAAGCSNNPANPLAPGGTAPPDGTAAGPGGTTLKVGTPSAQSPGGGGTLDTITPTLRIGNTRGTFRAAALSYEVELYKVNDLLRTMMVAGAAGDVTELAITDPLEHDTVYRWRVRARLEGAFGLWSAASDFRTPPPPRGGRVTGSVGANRHISPEEALDLIINYHDSIRADLGSRSSREQRIAFWFSALAIVHYGHPTYNPAGGDPLWCVKDAGGGRPPSDDVMVRCDSRDFWDTILGAGANGYSWHLSHDGRLPGSQNVYPPPAGALP
jgi:hypothetical protein